MTLDLAPHSPAPKSASRILGVDLARGIALLGMVVAHVGVTSTDLGSYTGWLGLAHGRSSILFCLLAGISLGIISGRRRPYLGLAGLQTRTRVLVRAVLLLAIAGALAMLDTFVALILGFYAVWFMLALPFLAWGARRLLVVGSIWLVVAAIAMPYLRALFSALGWTTDAYGVNGAALEGLFGLYPGFVWFGLVLVGMGLARLDLSSRKIALLLVGAGVAAAAIGYGGGHVLRGATEDIPDGAFEAEDDDYPGQQTSGQMLAMGAVDDGSVSFEEEPFGDIDVDVEDPFGELGGSGLLEPWHLPGVPGLTFDTDADWPSATELLAADAHSATPVEMLGSGGVALAILGGCLLLPRIGHTLLLPVRAVGTMSLTAYSAHVVAIAWWPDTFASWDSESNTPLLILVLALAVGCTAWYLLLGRGPLERLMHTVSMRAASAGVRQRPDDAGHAGPGPWRGQAGPGADPGPGQGGPGPWPAGPGPRGDGPGNGRGHAGPGPVHAGPDSGSEAGDPSAPTAGESSRDRADAPA
ncbi:Putative membrane protein [Actinomycetales bacterium JB111]|nr:Putative membrane protein [Actinomycetales bacterium JB111]